MRGQEVAPQSGHVSNFYASCGPLIEPPGVYCSQRDSSAPPTLVQGGAQSGPVSNSRRDPVNSGCAGIRLQTGRIALPFATFRV
jgi:hypothetical protein